MTEKLPLMAKRIMQSTCYFTTGSKQSGFIVSLGSDRLFMLRAKGNLDEKWEEWFLQGDTLGIQNHRKQGLAQLDQSRLIAFGGERTRDMEDTDESYILTQSKTSKVFHVTKGPRLPRPCLPQQSSYLINSTSFHYFVSTFGHVYRLNKQDLTWAQWRPNE